MTLQSTAQIGRIIRDGVVFDVKNWTQDMSNSNQLIDAVQNLFALLKQRRIDYVLVGGIAILYYVEGRNTQDLDLIMALSSLDALPEFKVTSKDTYFVRADYYGLQIDVLLTQNPLFKKVHDQFTKVQSFLDQDIPLATVDGLLLLKLYALPSLYRQGNFARVGIYENDVATLLHYYQPNVPALLTELSSHLSESDMAEVRSIVSDIQTRISRFRNETR